MSHPNDPHDDVAHQDGLHQHETASEYVCRELAAHVDPGYRVFMSKLIPTVDPRRVVGVRTPDLRRIAREVARRDDADTYRKALPHRLFEENQVHALLFGYERDYDQALARYQAFIPYVDNWATCDQIPVKVLAARPDETFAQVEAWLASGRCYTARFGIGVLMHLYLGELFDPAQLALVARTRLPAVASKDDVYYLNMMRAWYFAEALAQQQDAALPYLERWDADSGVDKGMDNVTNNGESMTHGPKSNEPDRQDSSLEDVVRLDEWTRHKAIQKAIESRKIPNNLKTYLRTCR